MDKDRLRVKGITEQKGNQTRFVWLPQLLSATFSGPVGGTSRDLRVDA